MRVLFLSGIAALTALFTPVAAGAATNPLGLTTLEQRIAPDGAAGFNQLTLAPGEAYVVREDGLGSAQAGREGRRVSFAYFGQLSDFQLADEESPARVEFIDPVGPPVEAAFRPWEALNPFIDDAMVRQVNAFVAASPVAAGNGSHAAMAFSVETGDLADSQQLNETEWVRTLLEGGQLDPNSGIDPVGYTHQTCPPLGVPGAAEAARYTGIQDYDDYTEGATPYFYDPDDPRGKSAGWPAYPGLMDRAQQSFTAAGLSTPSYIAFGNHDGLVQGNQSANKSFEDIATGCLKPMEAAIGASLTGLEDLTPEGLEDLFESSPTALSLVPPDPDRQYVSKAQYKEIFRAGTQADGHGFGYTDPAEEAASNGAAGYYSFVPIPGLRMIALDTVCEGGVTGPCADGNIDNPQYLWLEGELEEATDADQLVVIFSHHAIPSLTADVPDEVAPACTAPDAHGHDVNPGCDLDPRTSTPIHLGEDMEELLHRFPHVIAWVAGHSHVNDVAAYPAPDGESGFWSIRTAAEADWPQQARLLQIFDNDDGTLSIFGTIVDHASEVTAPAPGTAASGLDTDDLASIGRTLSFNDSQTGGGCEPNPCGEGEVEDRNVELLIDDPREGPAPGGDKGNGGDKGKGDEKGKGRGKGRNATGCANVVSGGMKGETLLGTSSSDLLLGKGGRDRIKSRAGEDCVYGGRGRDRIYARGGGRDEIRCGPGKDVAFVDRADTVKGCERVRTR